MAQLAHELRNPLAPIITALHATRLRGLQTPEQVVIERQVTHLRRLIDDLLDVSRITRGKLEVRKQVLELSSVVQSSVEACRPSIDLRGQRLTVEVPPEPLCIDGDLVRLTQVFTSLLSNAAKFTEARGRISLTVERQDEEAVLRIADSGVGIPVEEVSQVFDIFFQGSQTFGGTREGLGIGLFLVKRLVELHGGRAEANSAGPDGGSEFTVRLPLVAAPEQPSVFAGLG